MWDGVSEPDPSLRPEIAAAGISAFVDTNIVGEALPSIDFLWRCREAGWIRLQRTDVIATEYLNLPPDLAYKQDIADGLAEAQTPFVVGHSRLDHSVVASEEDMSRIETAFRILHPRADMRRTRRNNVRDAMTIAGVARYAGQYLVTLDGGILRKADSVRTVLGVECVTPDEMQRAVLTAIARTVRNREITGHPAWIPAWRPDNDDPVDEGSEPDGTRPLQP